VSDPAIKGVVYAAVSGYLKHRVARGDVSRGEIEKQLEAEDLELLDGEVSIASWVPIARFDALLDFTVQAFAEGDANGYLRKHGAFVARTLQQTGLYQQLVSREAGEDQSAELSIKDVRRTLSLWQGIINFSTPRCDGDPDASGHLFIEVEDAQDFSSGLRLANAGFLEEVFTNVGGRPIEISIGNDFPSHFTYRLQLSDD
jgi:hypothetical protein